MWFVNFEPRVPPDAEEPLRDVVESFESDAAELGRDPASLWRDTERRDAERESCLNENKKSWCGVYNDNSMDYSSLSATKFELKPNLISLNSVYQYLMGTYWLHS